MRSLRVLRVAAMLSNSSSPWTEPAVTQQIESLRRLGLQIDVLNLSEIAGGPRKYLSGIVELRRRLRAVKYDVVHANYSYCGWVARCQRGTPVVVTFMGSDLLGERNTSGRRTLRGFLDSASSQLLVGFVDHLIVMSRPMAARIHFKGRVSVIPTGVDLEMFAPQDQARSRAQLGLGPDKKIVLFAASPEDPNKNYALAKQAVQLLNESAGDCCSLLLFWRRSHAEMPAALNAADALVVTSHSEGSPNLVKEAMACNLPIVAVRVGDVPEVIAGAENCYLTDYDAADIASKLRLVIQSNRRSDGREHMQHLRLEAIAQRVYDTYNAVLEARRAA